LRLRARVAASDDDRANDLRAAVDTARKQGASIFELRSAIDDFELNGSSTKGVLAAAVGRFSADSDWPDLVRARAMLG
jgi:hypothetical protein